MKAYDVFKEYIWLVNTIRKAHKISLAEINEKWRETDMSGGVDFARATFNRHKDAIQDIFGIYIECDRKAGHKYYIGNSRVLEEDSVQNWMLTALSVSNTITESLSLQNRILLERIPEDGHLATFIQAMKDGKRVSITYRRFGSSNSRSFRFAPYAIKTFHQRWYVLAYVTFKDKSEEPYFCTFAFDRIESVEILDESFKISKDFDAEEFFQEYYGIVHDTKTPIERVVLRAYSNVAYALETLPLHRSQVMVSRTEKFSDYELTLRPTMDFIAKLLSHGAWVKVLQPQWLADELHDMHKKAMEMYEKQ